MPWRGEARRAKTAPRRGRRHAVPPPNDPGVSVAGKTGKSDTRGRLRKSLWNVGPNLPVNIRFRAGTRMKTRKTGFAATTACCHVVSCALRSREVVVSSMSGRSMFAVAGLPVFVLSMLPSTVAPADEAVPTVWQSTEKEDYTIDREEVFEFAKKPVVARKGDSVTIEFETKGFCDVAVAIEDTGGKILRHLASGVLGPNAPEPFKHNSKAQRIVWDGKNDLGKYLDNKNELIIRVSLGLKPQFEKTLFWHPKKVCALRRHPRAVAQAEGVYVYDGGGAEQIKLFGHNGKYIRTVYPFPADKVQQVKGLKWHTFADGHSAPAHRGYWQATYLSSGTGLTTADWGTAATAFAVHDGRIAVVPWSKKKGIEGGLVRLRTDGTSGDLSLDGPAIDTPFPAESAAFSPDGKWLYLAGIYRQVQAPFRAMPPTVRFRPEVYRVAYDGTEPPKLWQGGKTGKGDDEFNHPASLCVDAKGRVYVADNQNDRVQVFSPEGKLVKSVSVRGPYIVQIHHTTQELYVFSWTSALGHGVKDYDVPAVLRIFDPFKSDKPKQAIPIPIPHYRSRRGPAMFNDAMPLRAVLDSYTEPATIWMVRGFQYYNRNAPPGVQNWETFQIKDGRFVPLDAWNDDVVREVVKFTPPGILNQRLLVDPATGMLHSLESGGAVTELYRIDPASGRISVLNLPYTANEIAFDYSGHLLLRCNRLIGRYTNEGKREVPFDYGEERNARWASGARSANLRSAIVLPGNKPVNWIETGLTANPIGEIAVFTVNSAARWKRTRGFAFRPGTVDTVSRKYVPGVFPGRKRFAEIHAFDKHGKAVGMDIVGQGTPNVHDLKMDPRGDLYLLVAMNRTYKGKHFYPLTGCVIKFQRGRGRFLSTKGEIGLTEDRKPDAPQQIAGYWVQDAEWVYPGVGFARNAGPCTCWYCGFALDTFGRSFIPERIRNQVAVLDSNGNLILHVGKYGNVDDGVPLVEDMRYRSQTPRSIGGDEVSLMHTNFTGVHSDRRLFISDTGNGRILSVELGYHSTERVALANAQNPNER